MSPDTLWVIHFFTRLVFEVVWRGLIVCGPALLIHGCYWWLHEGRHRRSANHKARERLMELMTDEERAHYKKRGYVWIKSKDDTFEVLIPGMHIHQGTNFLPMLRICGGQIRYACILSSFEGTLPRMDFWISVYLHTKNSARGDIYPHNYGQTFMPWHPPWAIIRDSAPSDSLLRTLRIQ